ncbi:N-acetyltransferase [Xylanibacillus composti]|uniref:N-acetyltransferase n=1 Tax=Xylanibacillus composti TaxID=1572762 RepID=A0A8J4H8Y1_9BACL|nr:GNAT family protein [Xylanibacillus composti]MDT9725945.1 N-acetyltransferase [Xylanibacillus composti]GIQ71258.1 N-acetyltransferase [Xylanibacillus composti]
MINIRKFEKRDIPFKVKWINDPAINKYLHYDLPLTEEKTEKWYETLEERHDRIDYTIFYQNKPVGIIGFLNIDKRNRKAEYYICIGESAYLGKGVALQATDLLIREANKTLGLEKIYLFTEIGNVRAQEFFRKVGFEKEGLLKKDLIYNGRYIDRFIYALDVKLYIKNSNGVNINEN